MAINEGKGSKGRRVGVEDFFLIMEEGTKNKRRNDPIYYNFYFFFSQ
jgi:hypothetical protein